MPVCSAGTMVPVSSRGGVAAEDDLSLFLACLFGVSVSISLSVL